MSKKEEAAAGIQPVAAEGTEMAASAEGIVVFKINRNLTADEYEELQKRVRLENERSGVRIVLAPYSVDASIETA